MDGRRKNKFFFSNIITGVSTQIIIYDLNKVHEMSVWWRNVWYKSVQSLDDKKKKVQYWLRFPTKGAQSCTPHVQLMYLSYTAIVTPLYNDANSMHIYKSCLHGCMNHVSNGLTFKGIKTNKMLCYFIFIIFFLKLSHVILRGKLVNSNYAETNCKMT